MRRGIERAVIVVLALSACPEAPAPVPAPLPTPPAPKPQVAVVPPEAAIVDAGTAPETAADAGEGPAFVLSIGGEVQIQRQGSDAWVKLSVGEVVRVGDRLRTSGDGELGLSFDAAQIRLHAESEVLLDAIDPTSVRLSVSGNGEAVLADGKGKVTFAAGDKGRMAVTVDGKDVIAGSLMGDGTLTRGDQTVKLKNGEFVVAKAEGKPKPAKIPKVVSLDVDWPEQTETNQTQLKLKGRASAYARVFVGGRKVEPVTGGAFEGLVTLKRGKQNVVVTAVDPFGRRAVRSKQFVMDPDAPSIKGAVEYR